VLVRRWGIGVTADPQVGAALPLMVWNTMERARWWRQRLQGLLCGQAERPGKAASREGAAGARGC
jgi:hypothetical protein